MIVAVPRLFPSTTPDPRPTEATVISELLQVPPGVVLLSADVAPRHTFSDPEIAGGGGVIVTMVVFPDEGIHPIASVTVNV